MLNADDTELATALADSHSPEWRVSAYYGPELTVPDVPISADGSLEFDGDQDIQGSGTIYVRRDTGPGELNLIPKDRTDPLAPYGQEVSIDRVIRYGDREWVIPMGRFPIVDVPSMREYLRNFRTTTGDRSIVVGFALQAKLRDRFDLIRNSEFLYPTAPQQGNGTWAEIQRISPIPIVRSLPDAALPADLVYSTSRMEAITTLARNIGGVPHLTRQGALTVRARDRWLTVTAPEFRIPAVIDLDDGMSSALRNVVIVTNPNDATILGYAAVEDPLDPLYYQGPFGTRVERISSPLVNTQAEADTAAATALRRVSTRQSRVAKVTMLPDPRLELGDYGTFVDSVSGRELDGEILAMSFSLDPLAEMRVDVIAAEVR